MRPLTARLEHNYCNITVANHRLITVIKFVVKSYIHPLKDFTNKFRLVLHTYKNFFSEIMCATRATQTNRALVASGRGGRGARARLRTSIDLRWRCPPPPGVARQYRLQLSQSAAASLPTRTRSSNQHVRKGLVHCARRQLWPCQLFGYPHRTIGSSNSLQANSIFFHTVPALTFSHQPPTVFFSHTTPATSSNSRLQPSEQSEYLIVSKRQCQKKKNNFIRSYLLS